MPSRSIPDIQILPVQALLSVPVAEPAASSVTGTVTGTVTDLREKRIEEFLQA